MRLQSSSAGDMLSTMVRNLLKIAILVLVAGIAVYGGGCAQTARIMPEPDGVAETVSRETAFYDRWNAYVAWEEELDFQDNCAPFLREPDDGVTYKGTVVFLHGFSACPQQYFDLAELLAAEGYRTLVPVLPGHGRPYPDINKDDSGGLPGPNTWRKAYDAFAAQINGVMAMADGERVIGGLSGGGAATLYLVDEARDVYDRALVMAPFIAIAGGGFVNGTVAFVGSVPVLNLVSATPFNTADFCINKRRQGKASYCKWQVRAAQGMRAVGQEAAKRVAAKPLELRMQIVGVEGDNSVSLDRVRDLVDTQSATDSTTSCFYPKGVPHSMFSRWDHPGEDMYWLDDFNKAAVAFVTTGAAYPASPQDDDTVDGCTLTDAPVASAATVASKLQIFEN